MKNLIYRYVARALMALLVGYPLLAQAFSPKPDLTAAGAITTLKADTNSSPLYGETYNLGATGLRGWIYIDPNDAGEDGLQTAQSRQILVTVASTPGSAVLAVNDVILGVLAGSSGTVSAFTSDCRKAFGVAIGEAEKTGAGTLRVKRWRAGITADVNIPMTIMGNYTDTAPYTCPKSALILANARIKLVGQLLADPNFLTSDWAGGINGLALLAGVASGDANYATVQTRLQTFARTLAAAPPSTAGLYSWDWGYLGLFLSEYYLSTGDAQVITGLNNYTVALAQVQSRYGTYNHVGSLLKADGSLHGSCPPYGPVNQAGIIANLGIVVGKKALVAAGQVIDPEIDPAIQRGSDYFAWYVNKGSIPYGEHPPWMGNHSSNGKDALTAVFFGLQAGRAVETEYYSRMAIAGFNGREYGHTGQGFCYLWGALGANMGGSLAVAEYLKNVRWHLDLERRTDGSFVYDGAEQYGAGSTSDGTYLGASSYEGMNPISAYILTYALPLKRLYITGKNAIPANTLDATKVANAIAAATTKQDCTGYTTTQLISALSEFDPIVRNYCANELAKRSLSSIELTTLRDMISGTNANGRIGACQTLGILKDATALPLIIQRLDKAIEPVSWVRGNAAIAIRSYTSAAASVQRDTMLTAFTTNATDPEVIVWDDPVQIANNYLSLALFGNAVPDGSTGNDIGSYVVNAPKNLLYPAVKAGLKQPDSYSRFGAAVFVETKLPFTDIKQLALDIFEVITTKPQADPLWSYEPQLSGIRTLQKHHCAEGLPMALSLLNVKPGYGWDASVFLPPGIDAVKFYGDIARWTRPIINDDITIMRANLAPSDFATINPLMVDAIASIDNAITSPSGLINLLPLATPQVVATTGPKAITLTGTSPRTAVTFTNVTAPAHGTLTGTAPNMTYTPAPLYSGPDSFTFQVVDNLITSEPGTVSIIVGTAGTGLKAEYYDNADFTNLKLTRTDAQVNFDWGTGSPDASIGVDTFSTRWSGLLLVPETGIYTFSTLNSDGVRLYVNGVAMLDKFGVQATNWNDSASIGLIQGQLIDLQMDYYENTGSAVAKLKWTGPSFAGANGAIIGKEWLFSSAGLTFTPYAHSQNVSLSQNAAQAITLTGSGGTLTYSVVTPPAHGTLSGTAPNLTYTPATNYNGADSFTFIVNNGTSNSAPATVSIGISAGLPVSFNWLNAAAGNWSAAGNWTSATAPAATGLPTYNLNFTPSGTYTVSHDLNNGFQLNQLTVAGDVTITGTNSLAFTANGFLLPQFNQNSSSAVTVDTPLNLAAMTTFGSTSVGAVTMTKLISGTGGLTKNGAGTLQIYGVTQNTYSGGTIINSGTLHVGAIINDNSPVIVNPLGTGPVTMNGGIIIFDRVTASNALTVNGGTFDINNGWGATWSGPISGAGALTKTGTTAITLSGNNSSFSGPKLVTEGNLSFTATNSLGTGPITIATGAKVDLSYSKTATAPAVAGLTLGGVAQLPGTYGSSTSNATNKSNTWFTGNGKISVLPASSTALALTGGATPAAPGASLTFTATVTGSSPAGSVAFYDGTTLLGSSTLSAAQASFTTSTLASGSRSITARYAGTNNAPSTSAPLVINVLPTAPTIFATSSKPTSINLAWTQTSGVTGYNVKRSLTSGGAYTLVAILGANQYVDTTVSQGTQYFYVVSALGGTGEGSNSAQVSITTLSTFQDWISQYNMGGLTGLTDDYDHDGQPNYLEFALNSNPTDGNTNGKIMAKLATVGGTPQVLTLTLAVRSGATFAADSNNQKAVVAVDQLTYVITASSNLSDWGTPVVSEVTGTDATAIQSGLPAPDSGWTYKTFRSAGAVSGNPSDFIRVTVTSP